MTDKQINQRIAEACGFVCLHEFQSDKNGAKFAFWEYPPTWTGPKKQPWCLDFCSDLNAMHEAEKVLAPIDLGCMSYWLGIILPKNAELFHATARQRAEAFLRTLGKWEEATNKESLTVQDVGWPPPGTRCSRMNADGKWEEVQG